LDGAAFGACTSPKEYAGLSSGQHTLRARAIDASGTPDPTPAERMFTVPDSTPPPNAQPSGGESGGVLGSDRTAPRIIIRPRRARVSTNGSVSLRVSCPAGESTCRVQLRLRLGRRYVATRTLSMAGGTTRSFRLKLSRYARRQLARTTSLRTSAVATARDAAGNQSTARMAVRLLAPRRR
jgi:hypothetical protein